MIHRYDVAVSELVMQSHVRLQSVRGVVEHTSRIQAHRGMTHHRLRSIFELWELPTKGWRFEHNPSDLFKLSDAIPCYRESITLECEATDSAVAQTSRTVIDARYSITDRDHVVDVVHPEASFRLRCQRAVPIPASRGGQESPL